MSRLATVVAALILAGCAQTHDVTTACPAIKAYDPAFLKSWDDALAGRGEADPLVIISGDYIGLRDEVRACRSAR